MNFAASGPRINRITFADTIAQYCLSMATQTLVFVL